MNAIKLDDCIRCGKPKMYHARVCPNCAENDLRFYRHALFDIYEMRVNKTKAASLMHARAANALREAGVL